MPTAGNVFKPRSCEIGDNCTSLPREVISVLRDDLSVTVPSRKIDEQPVCKEWERRAQRIGGTKQRTL
ncbi:unnamed protein product [Toxocara canis]|uniref:AbrB/MazE/SpoVT family DNA-binding domain-containing protein n=1 Tax=Toxocara canis TaxID=6265 RepID=A0A183UYE1_TOXCA|nr:unnamed protein product [Toxocara canis]